MTDSSNATLQNMDTSINIASLLLAIGIDNKELEAKLFVGNIEMALEYDSLSMDYAQDVYDQRMDAASQAFTAHMASAGGSAFSAASNGRGAYKMGKFKADNGIPEFQQSLQNSDTRIAGLKAQKAQLESTEVKTSNNITGRDGETAGAAGENGKLLKDVTEPEYQSWKEEQARLKSDVDNPQAAGLDADDAAVRQQELTNVERNIRQYDELQGVNSQLSQAQSDRNMMVINEQRRQADQAGMKWRAVGEFGRSGFEFWSGFEEKASQESTAMAGLDEASQNWVSKRGEAFNSLAQDHLSNSNGVDQYINNAYRRPRAPLVASPKE